MVAPNIRKVQVHTLTVPEVGDKFSNFHGQKGVAAAFWPEEDMPFVCSGPNQGMKPDVLFSPASLTSRMTMGVLLEMLQSKASCLDGSRWGIDEQFFEKATRLEKRKKLEEILKAHGFAPKGTERMADGKTGRMLEASIMMGPIYYGTLWHKAFRKAHARATGPIQHMTRQPVEGRRRKGGFRLGAMEFDCLVAWGVAALIRQRMVDLSDPFEVYICKECGNIADVNVNLSVPIVWCRVCEVHDYIRRVPIAYSAMLMLRELNSTGILTKLILQDLEQLEGTT